jgi:hypothetical protein
MVLLCIDALTSPQLFRNILGIISSLTIKYIFTLTKRGMPTEFISTKSEQQQENKLLDTVDHCFGTH